MMKAYLLVYGNEFANRESIKIFANSSPLIFTWRYDLPNSFYLISEASAKDIGKALEFALGKSNNYIITEIENNYWGRSSDDTWYLIKNKNTKPPEANNALSTVE